MTRVLLGTGVLTWNSHERRSDRYGSVYLIPEGQNSLSSAPAPSQVSADVRLLCGRRGDLVAVVKATRQSTHIGDLFRGVQPTTPEVGEIIVLGEGGRFFAEGAPEGGFQVGLRPPDDRPNDWLRIDALYRAHEQTVDLFFGESR